MRTLLILAAMTTFTFSAFGQTDTSQEPTGGTTQTRDANASLGDATSDEAESTENRASDHKDKRAKKKAKKSRNNPQERMRK